MGYTEVSRSRHPRVYAVGTVESQDERPPRYGGPTAAGPADCQKNREDALRIVHFHRTAKPSRHSAVRGCALCNHRTPSSGAPKIGNSRLPMRLRRSLSCRNMKRRSRITWSVHVVFMFALRVQIIHAGLVISVIAATIWKFFWIAYEMT